MIPLWARSISSNNVLHSSANLLTSVKLLELECSRVFLDESENATILCSIFCTENVSLRRKTCTKTVTNCQRIDCYLVADKCTESENVSLFFQFDESIVRNWKFYLSFLFVLHWKNAQQIIYACKNLVRDRRRFDPHNYYKWIFEKCAYFTRQFVQLFQRCLRLRNIKYRSSFRIIIIIIIKILGWFIIIFVFSRVFHI